jgi:hypothetical protein
MASNSHSFGAGAASNRGFSNSSGSRFNSSSSSFGRSTFSGSRSSGTFGRTGLGNSGFGSARFNAGNNFGRGFGGGGFGNRGFGFGRGFGCWGCGFDGFGWGFGFGPGFGWGGFWNPWFWGSSLAWGAPYPYYDPYWDWPPYGYYPPPVYRNYNYGAPYDAPSSAPANNDDSVYGPYFSSGNADSYGSTAPSAGTPDTDPTTANVAISAPTILVYLKDGTTLAADDYWMADGQFHYRVKYGGESSVGTDEVDMQRTVDENAKRGVRFTLKPKPAAEI